MTLSAFWRWLTRGPQVPYQAIPAYRYRPGMESPDRRYAALPGAQAREIERRAREARKVRVWRRA